MEYRVQKWVTKLKKILEVSVLAYPYDRDPNTLTTNASLTGIGAILNQKQGTEDRVIAYASKTGRRARQYRLW